MWQRIPTVHFDCLGGIALATSIFANLLLSVYTSDVIGAWVSKLVYEAIPPIIGVEKVNAVLHHPLIATFSCSVYVFAILLCYSLRQRNHLCFPLGSLVLALLCGNLRAILLGFGYLIKVLVWSAPLSILLLGAILHYSLIEGKKFDQKGKLDKAGQRETM